jgi:methyl-accepting chemotaxis protein
VEAARAGEQGRGFAVVASEVRSLARRSAQAAKEIKSLINTSVERVAQGASLVDQAGATMTEVVSSIRHVTDIMGAISGASSEQSVGVSQITETVTHMDQVTQQNAALVEEMSVAASRLKSQAQELVQTVAVFKLSGHDVAPLYRGASPMARASRVMPRPARRVSVASVKKPTLAGSPQHGPQYPSLPRRQSWLRLRVGMTGNRSDEMTAIKVKNSPNSQRLR